MVNSGTGSRARVEGHVIAGKTGTSNDENDAWFVGFSPSLVTGVYVGFDQLQSLGKQEQGGRTAAPIFRYYRSQIEDLYKDRPPIPPAAARTSCGRCSSAAPPRCLRGGLPRMRFVREGRSPGRGAAPPRGTRTHRGASVRRKEAPPDVHARSPRSQAAVRAAARHGSALPAFSRTGRPERSRKAPAARQLLPRGAPFRAAPAPCPHPLQPQGNT